MATAQATSEMPAPKPGLVIFDSVRYPWLRVAVTERTNDNGAKVARSRRIVFTNGVYATEKED